MKKGTNTFHKNLILLFSSIVLCTLFAEAALRIALPSPVIWKFPQENYIYDPQIGHRLEPGQHAFTHDKTVTTNSAGIRDSEYSLIPPPGTYRILALGDSQTFGNGLELKDSWPKQLESKLNQSNSGTKFEVINSGLPASDTWQHEIILKRMITNYHPHSVVLAFYVNDVATRSTPNPARHKTENKLKNRFIYTLKRSVLLLTLYQAYHSIQHALAPNIEYLRQQALLNGVDDNIIKERWKQVENSLSVMKKITDQKNITFMIASIPRRDQVDGRLPWNAYNKRLKTITERYNIPMVSMLEPLQQGYKKYKKDLFIPWDGHNSKIANHIIAKELSDSIATPTL